jgi:hypothetical protein
MKPRYQVLAGLFVAAVLSATGLPAVAGLPEKWTPLLTCDDGRGTIDTLVFRVNEYNRFMFKAEIYNKPDIVRYIAMPASQYFELFDQYASARASIPMRNPIFSESDFSGAVLPGTPPNPGTSAGDEVRFERNRDARTVTIRIIFPAYTYCTGTVDSDGMCRGGEYVDVPAKEVSNWIFKNCHAW